MTAKGTKQSIEEAATELRRKIIGREDEHGESESPKADTNLLQKDSPAEQLDELGEELESSGADESNDAQRDSNAENMPKLTGTPEDTDVENANDSDLEDKMSRLRQSVAPANPPMDSSDDHSLSEKVERALEKAEENRERMTEIPSEGVEDDIQELKIENRELEAEVEQTRDLLSEVESENESLAAELDEISTAHGQDSTGLEEVESHLDVVDQRLEEVSDEVREHDQEIDSLHDKRKELAEKLESLALRVDNNERGQVNLAEKLDLVSKEIDRYERRLREEEAPESMVEEKDRMKQILNDLSEAANEPESPTTNPEQNAVEQELSAFQNSGDRVTEQDFKELLSLVEKNSERLENLSQRVDESSPDGQGLSAVNQEVAGLRGRMQRNEREIQRILDTVEELSEILKMELRSGGL